MATETLFGAATPPLQVGNEAGENYTLGLRIIPTVDGLVSAVRFWQVAGGTTPVSVGIWRRSTGALLASTIGATVSQAAGWVSVPLAAPLAVTGGVEYIVGRTTRDGYYAAASTFFTADGYSNGANLFAPQSGGNGAGADGNGLFWASGDGLGLPDSSFNSTNYFVDVVFEAGAAPPAGPAVGAVLHHLRQQGIA